MNFGRLALAGLVLIACLVGGFIALFPPAGPGMTVTYSNAIKGMDINIKSARLSNGSAFPDAGSLSGASIPNENPLSGDATMGGAPDGRDLPEYVDFEWRESPRSPPDPTPMDPLSQAHKDWEKNMMDDFYSQPIKKQRVVIRNRVPAEVVNAVTGANRHSPSDQLTPASIEIFFIWTDNGIKLRWQIWHRPPSGIQYYSHHGGDEIVPTGTTMIAGYSNTIKNDKFTVILGGPDGAPMRYPASASGPYFSGTPGFAYTSRPIAGGERLVAFESEPELPEWVEFNWRLFPTSIPRKFLESDSAYAGRVSDVYDSLIKKHERILVRSRIPREVRDEITAATHNAEPHKVASSVIYLYFVWTDSGIKLHWRLKRSRPDKTFISVREGGDQVPQSDG